MNQLATKISQLCEEADSFTEFSLYFYISVGLKGGVTMDKERGIDIECNLDELDGLEKPVNQLETIGVRTKMVQLAESKYRLEFRLW